MTTAERRKSPCDVCGQKHERCGGHRQKREGETEYTPCMKTCMIGRDVCHKHGGPNHGERPTTGMRSMALERAGLKEWAEELRRDPHLLHVTEEVVVLRARFWQILEEMPDGIGPSFLADVFALYQQTMRGTDEKRAWARARLGEKLEEGAGVSQSWQDALLTLDQLRRMARVQQQHEERLRRYIPVEYVILMFNRLADALRKRVQDDALMADKRAFMDAVADDFDRIATTVMVDPKEQKALPEPYEPQE
jgi:hypothetical protein